MNRTIHNITQLGDIKTFGGRLDEHTKIDSYYLKGKDYIKVDNEMFVWNISRERIAKSVTKGYQVIQHRDVFNTIHDALSNLNLEVAGRLDDLEDVARMDIVFKNQDKFNIDDKEKGIQLGIRVINSNNKRSSFRLEMYAFRLICQNGMSVGNMIPAVREIKIHYGNEKIELNLIQKMTESFVKKVINHSKDLQKLVNVSMKDSIEWNILENIMKKVIKSKKYLNIIADKLGIDVMQVIDKKTNKVVTQYIPKDPKKKITRWELYNAVTNVISHDQQLKTTAQSSLEESSRKILKNSYEKLQEIVQE